MKILLATQKPFSQIAVNGIKQIVEESGNELIILEKYTKQEELIEAVKDIDAMIIRSDKVNKEVIQAAKNLKIIVRAGAGYDNVDLVSASENKIVVENTPGQNSNAVAELVLGMLIYMYRNELSPSTGREIIGKTIGIQAFGNVGRLVGEKAKALGMQVKAIDPFLSKEKIEETGAVALEKLEDLYSTCDIVSLHIPATSQTIKSIGYELLSKLPKGGLLINTARKEVIDEDGLAKILEEREDIKYITDVMPDNYNELREKFGNRIFATSKKMGAQTQEANINAGLAAIKQIIAFFNEGCTKFQVNK